MIYLKQALRSLQKNKLFSTLNIIGFAIGFTVCLVIALYIYRENSTNSFFPNPERTYRLKVADDNKYHFDIAIYPIIKEQYPEIEKAMAMTYLGGIQYHSVPIKIDDKSFKAHEIISTTNDFFDFTEIDILASMSDKPFADNNSVVLSKATAIKLFGHYNIVGKTLHMSDLDLTISAVADDIPSNATFGAEIYLNDERIGTTTTQNCINGDCFLVREIFLKVQKGTDVEALTQKLNANFPENRNKVESVEFQPVRSIYFSEPSTFVPHKTGNKKILWIFTTIALLTLFMSLFNYVNYTISKQLQTLKQMGIRLATGAGKFQIFRYYLVEVSLSIIIALILAIIFTSIALPWTEQLFQEKLDVLWLLKPSMIAITVIALMVIVLLSAWFPVSLIWKSNITSLLGKSNQRIKASSLSKIMTVAQLVVSVVLLTSLLLVNKQLHFVKTANYGFETEQLLRIDLPNNYNNYSVIKEAFAKLPFITDLSLASHAPGVGWSNMRIGDENGEELMAYTMRVDADFINTFQIDVVQGRNGTENDINRSALISETTFRKLGWEDIEGRDINGWGVIGVVNELQYDSMHSLATPMVFFYTNSYFNTLNVRLLPENFSEQLSQMKNAWKQAGIEEPFEFQFYNDYYNMLYQKEEMDAKALSVFSIIAFIITCLGMLAQIIQITERRVKEIGIRKIHGASIMEVVKMLNVKFVITVLIAVMIATPIAYYVMSRWLEGFAHKTDLSWWVFALSGLTTLAITLLTVSWQSWRAASRNPVEALRYE